MPVATCPQCHAQMSSAARFCSSCGAEGVSAQATPSKGIPAIAGCAIAAAVGFVLIAVIGILAGLLLPAIAQARNRARRAKCASNLSMIGRASAIYAMDNADKYPGKLSDMNEITSTPMIAICPSSGNVVGGPENIDEWSDYAIVASQADARPDRVHAYCRPENHDYEGANVLYIDGSVSWVRSRELEDLIDGVKASQ